MIDQTKEVILVDKNDNPLGSADKLAAHKKGLCHRAFSIFVFRKPTAAASKEDWEVLLQKRSEKKYHCAGLWSNTCCSHPSPGEDLITSGCNRLQMEMGFCVALSWVGSFHYRAELNNGLIEDEVDHVLVGFSQNKPFLINPDEVSQAKWMKVNDLQATLNSQPDTFTPWLKRALDVALLYSSY